MHIEVNSGDMLGCVSDADVRAFQFVIERLPFQPGKSYPFLPFLGWFTAEHDTGFRERPPQCECTLLFRINRRSRIAFEKAIGKTLSAEKNCICACYGRFIE